MVYNLPHVTKDGVTVANSINLEDPIENVACQIIKEAARKTADVAGDGTTTTTLLASYLVEEALKVSDNKLNLKKHLEELSSSLESIVKEHSKGIESNEELYNIAMIASNGDKAISELIVDIIGKIGRHGLINTFPSKSYKTSVEISEGLHLDRGPIDNMLKGKTDKEVFEEPKILVTDLDLHTIEDGIHVMELFHQIKKPLVIICNDIHRQALEVIAYNKFKDDLPLQVIRLPFIADARKEAAQDIAVATGAVAIYKDMGWNIQSIGESQLGSCDLISIGPKDTVISGRKGNKEDILARIARYNNLIENDHEGLAVNYKKRLALLDAGTAVIYVGGANEVEIQETRDRMDDTIRAVKASLEEGVVKGGLSIYRLLNEYLESNKVGTASTIFGQACIALNNKFFGYLTPEDREALINTIEQSNDIIDPTKVITTSIKNAISAACMIFTTETVVVKQTKND